LQHPYRIACSGDSVSSIAEELRRQVASLDAKPVPTTAKLPKLAFTFTGQGTLYLSLGMELYAESSDFRNSITRFDALAQQQGYPSFLPIIDGSAKTLDDFDVCATHLALVCLQMGLVQLWASWGVSPSLVVGHSLGEYAALFAAEVLSASEAIHLVGMRATLLQRKCTPHTHAMVAIKGQVDSIQPFLQGSGCEIACRNQPTGTVVAGSKNDVDKLVARLRAENYECILLEIPFAFHSAQVDPILEEFALATAGVRYRSPKVHVLSPLLSQVIAPSEDGFDASYLVQACREPVNFQGALEAARTAGVVDDTTVWVELGAHPTCSGMVKGVFGTQSKTFASLRKSTDPWKSMTAALTSVYLAGFNVDWNNYHRDVPGAKTVLSLPRYKWVLKNHWIMYRNNFCLTKGEGSVPVSTTTAAPEAAPKYTYISPSIQRVLEESYDPLASHVLIESDIFHRDLFGVLRGHVVNGAYLCPSVSHSLVFT
jgi:naphtho-gamma-pyrone polyketide synthase